MRHKIGLLPLPRVYVLHGNGVFNAFALRFLNRNYIVLLSDIVDAIADDPDAINFYIGHEMGHLYRKHIFWQVVLAPALVLPLLGAGLFPRAGIHLRHVWRALHDSAGFRAEGAGGARRRRQTLPDAEHGCLSRPADGNEGFWMAFMNWSAPTPWLVKRVARVTPDFPKQKMPGRNPLAYLLAGFVPRLSLLSLVVIYLGVIIGSLVMSQSMAKHAHDDGSGYQSLIDKEKQELHIGGPADGPDTTD